MRGKTAHVISVTSAFMVHLWVARVLEKVLYLLVSASGLNKNKLVSCYFRVGYVS